MKAAVQPAQTQAPAFSRNPPFGRVEGSARRPSFLIHHFLFMLKGWRNTVLGTLVVLSGVSAAVITVVARRGGDWELTRLGAIASLLFALLIVIFVVSPLARSARAEAARTQECRGGCSGQQAGAHRVGGAAARGRIQRCRGSVAEIGRTRRNTPTGH